MTPLPSYRTLKLSKDGFIATLTLSRPAQLNIIDSLAHDEISDAIGYFGGCDDIRALIISAEGKYFSAGGDFDFMLEMNSAPEKCAHIVDDAVGIIENLLNLPMPVIAAVQGDAIGFGASLAFGCDMVVAATDAQFADPHVLVGLAAGDGGCLFWPQSAGLMRAKRYLLTGDYIQAHKAYEFGLVTDLVDDPGDVKGAALKIARKIASQAPMAVQGTKKSLNLIAKARAAEVMSFAAEQERQTIMSDDLREAVTAIREKRRPHYNGR